MLRPVSSVVPKLKGIHRSGGGAEEGDGTRSSWRIKLLDRAAILIDASPVLPSSTVGCCWPPSGYGPERFVVSGEGASIPQVAAT